MYLRHGFDSMAAKTRARLLYFMQHGYYALELREPMETRLAFVPDYVEGFTGQAASADEFAAFEAFARTVRDRSVRSRR